MCMVSCISLWCSSPQDECMFNTLPYYITDLFIIAYIYSKVIEGMTLPDVTSTRFPCMLLWCSTITSLVTLLMLKCHLLLTFSSHLKHYSLVSTSAVPGNKVRSGGPKSGPNICLQSATVGWTTGPWFYPFIDLRPMVKNAPNRILWLAV